VRARTLPKSTSGRCGHSSGWRRSNSRLGSNDEQAEEERRRRRRGGGLTDLARTYESSPESASGAAAPWGEARWRRSSSSTLRARQGTRSCGCGPSDPIASYPHLVWSRKGRGGGSWRGGGGRSGCSWLWIWLVDAGKINRQDVIYRQSRHVPPPLVSAPSRRLDFPDSLQRRVAPPFRLMKWWLFPWRRRRVRAELSVAR